MVVSVESQPDMRRRAFCATVSDESAEPLAATASRIDHWLLVEYRGLWDRDVLAGSLLSPELKAHLRAQLAALGRARLLFIKKPERRADRRRRVYFGTTRPGEERFFCLEFERHDDLRALDFAAALAGADAPGVPVGHPLFVVCTHGKRDRCCAKHGRPLYDVLRRATESSWVWQSTHVGGDRFAGNVVSFPHGLYFGRVGEEDVGPLVEACREGRILLERYRGRAAYPFAAQAAEHAVRLAGGHAGIADLSLVGWERDGARWSVRFRAPGGEVHEVDVAAELGEEPVYLTCSAVTPQRPRRYVATAHRVTKPR